MLQKQQPCDGSKPWIICILSKDGRRLPKTSMKYTKLFFLDEVTAFAAGHRPCGQCQAQRYAEFVAAWKSVTGKQFLDADLDFERRNQDGSKKTFPLDLKKLPLGAMFVGPEDGAAYLVYEDGYYRWFETGYEKASAFPADVDTVQVLTPASVVRMFAASFKLHKGAHDSGSFHSSIEG